MEEKEGEAATVVLGSNPRSNTYFPLILKQTLSVFCFLEATLVNCEYVAFLSKTLRSTVGKE